MLPSDWRPLSFGNQEGTPVLWYEAGIGCAQVPRLIYLMFTGENAPEFARYIGTQTFGKANVLVVHCYVGGK